MTVLKSLLIIAFIAFVTVFSGNIAFASGHDSNNLFTTFNSASITAFLITAGSLFGVYLIRSKRKSAE